MLRPRAVLLARAGVRLLRCRLGAVVPTRHAGRGVPPFGPLSVAWRLPLACSAQSYELRRPTAHVLTSTPPVCTLYRSLVVALQARSPPRDFLLLSSRVHPPRANCRYHQTAASNPPPPPSPLPRHRREVKAPPPPRRRPPPRGRPRLPPAAWAAAQRRPLQGATCRRAARARGGRPRRASLPPSASRTMVGAAASRPGRPSAAATRTGGGGGVW